MRFTFKQFTINQNDQVFKFGTDAALLSTWASLDGAQNALEVGCGSGVISLMLAQRYPLCAFTGIDISKEAVLLSKENMALSPFTNSFNFYHRSLQSFQSPQKYDRVVSNPPFFDGSMKSPSTLRNNTRHTDNLSLKDFLYHAKKMLSSTGKIQFIYPFRYMSDIESTAFALDLTIEKITYVKGRFNTPINRVLVSLSQHSSDTSENHLTLYNPVLGYTKPILDMFSPFYIKLE